MKGTDLFDSKQKNLLQLDMKNILVFQRPQSDGIEAFEDSMECSSLGEISFTHMPENIKSPMEEKSQRKLEDLKVYILENLISRINSEFQK